MSICQKCEGKISFFTFPHKKYPNPLGVGHLCKKCYEPYGLVLEIYTTNLNKVDSDPKAAAWVAVCYTLAARRINLMCTITAAISGFVEKQNSWRICKERALVLVEEALAMLSSDSDGQSFLNALYADVKNITNPPTREMPIQRYASVFEHKILDLEYEAVVRSGISIDELIGFASSLSSPQWLTAGFGNDDLESIQQT